MGALSAWSGMSAMSAMVGVAGPPAPPQTNLALWYKADVGAFSDAGTTPATDGATARQWNDQSGNTHTASQATAGARPVYRVAQVNGLPALQFRTASGRWMTIASGPSILQGTFCAIVRPLSTGGVTGVLFGESTFGGYYTLALADTAAPPNTNPLYMATSGGQTVGPTFNPYVNGAWQFITVVRSGTGSTVDMYVNGQYVNAEFSTGGTTPTILDNLGANVNGSNPGNFDLAEVIVYSDAKDAPTLAQLNAYAYARTGLYSLKPRVAISRPGTGQDLYNCNPAGCKLTYTTGEIIVAYRIGHGQLSDGTIKLVRSSDNGNSWSAPVTIVAPDPSHLNWWTQIGMVQLPNGNILLPLNLNDNSGSYVGSALYQSTDNGATFSHLADMTPTSGYMEVIPYGEILVKGNGTLLIPCSQRKASGLWDSCLLQSTDGGATTTLVGVILAGTMGSPNFEPTEPSVKFRRLTGGSDELNLTAGVREDNEPAIWTTTSTDGGATWAAATKLLSGALDCCITPLADNRFVLVFCTRGGRAATTGVFVSFDRGATWNANWYTAFSAGQSSVFLGANIGCPWAIEATPGKLLCFDYYIDPNNQSGFYPSTSIFLSYVDTASLAPIPTPTAAFTYTPATGASPLAVTFTDASSAVLIAPITGWSWAFGDGGTSTSQSPSHTFTGNGTYAVTLTVTNSAGTATVSHTVVVSPDYILADWQVADGTLLTAYSAPIGGIGTEFDSTAVFTITGHAAYLTHSPSDYGVFGWDGGHADGTITVTVTLVSGTNGRSGVAFRISDDQNLWTAEYRSDTGLFRIVNVTANSETVADSITVTETVGTPIMYTVALNGTSITASITGGSRNLTVTSSVRQTATKHGIFSNDNTNKCAFGTFQMTP